VRREGARPESAVRLSWGRAIAKARRTAVIIVKGEVRFGDGEIERLQPDLAANIQATRAEPGCAAYAYSVDVIDPNLLHIAEEWSSEDAIDAHMQSAHMAALSAALGTAKMESIRVDAYESHYLRNILGGDPPAGD
jgi:quinol monooxygenase YgiN